MRKKDITRELQLDLEELKATEELLNESFDFGEGSMKIEDTATLKTEFNELKDNISKEIEETKNMEEPKVEVSISRPSRKHDNYEFYKTRRLLRANSYFISEKTNDNDEVYYTRFYLSGCRKFAKRLTSKKVRKTISLPARGNGYRRTIDYWWILF